MSIEILAPGGSFEAVKAAVVAGADAVYIGLPRFSARAYAVNISLETLPEVVAYCHLRGVKVFAAVNTLVHERDLSAFLSDCEAAANAHIDAFIVQDFGAARLLRELKIPLHASTQMTIHSINGLKFAARQGFSRVILARELSRETIRDITALGSELGVETEVFVHGALCMSVSGQCYMSVTVGGRSGADAVRSANCGSCAGICRLPFSAFNFNPENFALSLKDLSILPSVKELENMGVASVKIEGRMKRSEYVFAAVRAASFARDGIEFDTDILQSVFSRSGFTDGYYNNTLTDMFGTRRKEDVTAAETILPELSSALSKAITADVQKIPLHMEISLKRSEPVVLTVKFEYLTVSVSGAVPEAAKSGGLVPSALVSQLSKTGGTPYVCEVVVTDMDEGLFLPKSAINALRREALEKINTARLETAQIPRNNHVKPVALTSTVSKKREVNGFVSMINNKNQLETALRYSDYVIVPIDIAESITPDDRIMITPPRFFADTRIENETISRLQTLRERGFKRLYAQNTAHIQIAHELGFEIHGGYGLNIENNAAVCEMADYGIRDITPCIESKINDLLYMCAETLTVYAYGRFPLMLTRNCPLLGARSGDIPGYGTLGSGGHSYKDVGDDSHERGGHNCNKCKLSDRFLTDRTGRRFPVKCSRRYGYTEILNADRMSVSGRYKLLPADRFLLDFYNETPETMQEIYEAFAINVHIPSQTRENITKGLYN